MVVVVSASLVELGVSAVELMPVGQFPGQRNWGYDGVFAYAVQNSYAPIPAVGRFDGGLSQLLRGDGSGHLFPIAAAESNLVVPGDAKALAVLDLGQDGWPGFLVTRNNSAALAFRNHGAAGKRPLAALRGAVNEALAVRTRGL